MNTRNKINSIRRGNVIMLFKGGTRVVHEVQGLSVSPFVISTVAACTMRLSIVLQTIRIAGHINFRKLFFVR